MYEEITPFSRPEGKNNQPHLLTSCAARRRSCLVKEFVIPVVCDTILYNSQNITAFRLSQSLLFILVVSQTTS